MRSALLWTVLGTVGSIIGAGAALYPLFIQQQNFVHLIALCPKTFAVTKLGFVYLSGCDEGVPVLRVETLSEPVILTGNAYLKRVQGDWIDDRSGALALSTVEFSNRRIPANDRFRWFDWYEKKGSMRVRKEKLESLVWCPQKAGEYEVGIEFVSKVGKSWAYTRLPFCFEEAPNVERPSEKEYWKNVPGDLQNPG